MRSKVLKRILDNTPKEVERFVDKYADLVALINYFLDKKGYTQKQLAEKLHKHPSEIHKWLSGEHNFTLLSISKLEVELGETLLEVPIHKHPIAYSALPEQGIVKSLTESLPYKSLPNEWNTAIYAYKSSSSVISM